MIIQQKEAQSEKLHQFIKVLKKQEGLVTEFDEVLWSVLVESVRIERSGKVVRFRDVTEVRVE